MEAYDPGHFVLLGCDLITLESTVASCLLVLAGRF